MDFSLGEIAVGLGGFATFLSVVRMLRRTELQKDLENLNATTDAYRTRQTDAETEEAKMRERLTIVTAERDAAFAARDAAETALERCLKRCGTLSARLRRQEGDL